MYADLKTAPDAGSGNIQCYFMSVFLPPTNGEVRTTSFLWTLDDSVAALRLAHDEAVLGKTDPDWWSYADHGNAKIVKIELVRSQLFRSEPRKNTLPELVNLPGCGFSMGKYEVTNAEFEAFMPEHRAYRSAYSWRGREPVIYVNWFEAARYCNFLSRKHNLTPAYNEKDWTRNPVANGFRLPTEAEWECAASGRGENRPYPWGKEAPTAKHGNFDLDALSISPVVRAQAGGGVTIVGSFPAGASRDGIMDLAGNVAEWCDDYYHPDPAHQGKPSPYRSIRGGSWGYYGKSQRVRDREFNNPGYPGYIYLGFRVVLPGK